MVSNEMLKRLGMNHKQRRSYFWRQKKKEKRRLAKKRRQKRVKKEALKSYPTSPFEMTQKQMEEEEKVCSEFWAEVEKRRKPLGPLTPTQEFSFRVLRVSEAMAALKI